MPNICDCGHSQTDHLGGRCANRQTRFDASVGGTVAVQCPCKAFNAPVKAVPAPVVVASEPVVEEVPEPEVIKEAVVKPLEDEPRSPVGQPHRNSPPKQRSATETPVRRRKK